MMVEDGSQDDCSKLRHLMATFELCRDCSNLDPLIYNGCWDSRVLLVENWRGLSRRQSCIAMADLIHPTVAFL